MSVADGTYICIEKSAPLYTSRHPTPSPLVKTMMLVATDGHIIAVLADGKTMMKVLQRNWLNPILTL